MHHTVPDPSRVEGDQFGWRATARQNVIVRIGDVEFLFLDPEDLRDFHAVVGRAADAFEAGYGNCDWCKATAVPMSHVQGRFNDMGDSESANVCRDCAEGQGEALLAADESEAA